MAATVFAANIAFADQPANEVILNPQATSVKTPQTATAKKPPRDAPRFELAARITMSQGYVKQASWLDEDNFIVLLMSPDSAEVQRFNYDTLERERFLSADFVQKYLSGAADADRLTWTISPRRKYLFFSWFLDDGSRQWKLVDISAAPSFRLRTFTPPAGMQIERALFSPDDRYAVFFHDSQKEGSTVSVLVLDLDAGTEAWRIPSSQLSFVKDAWWDGAVFDDPRFSATVMLRDGQFLDRPALVKANINAKQLDFSDNPDGVVTGATGLWGQVTAVQTKGGGAPYRLLVFRDGDRDQLPLSSAPARIEPLPDSGLILLSNNDDKANVGELWLVDVIGGSKYLVDGDCADFALNSAGRLLVRGEQTNELRFYEFVNPRKARPPSAEGEDAPRNPDAWVPH